MRTSSTESLGRAALQGGRRRRRRRRRRRSRSSRCWTAGGHERPRGGGQDLRRVSSHVRDVSKARATFRGSLTELCRPAGRLGLDRRRRLSAAVAAVAAGGGAGGRG
jgi:hypothetical protein